MSSAEKPLVIENTTGAGGRKLIINLPAPQFRSQNVLTVHPDGTVEFAEGISPSEAAQEFVQAVKRDVFYRIRDLEAENERLRAALRIANMERPIRLPSMVVPRG
jgi:hypothetical protein